MDLFCQFILNDQIQEGLVIDSAWSEKNNCWMLLILTSDDNLLTIKSDSSLSAKLVAYEEETTDEEPLSQLDDKRKCN